jgi:biotin-dependent carboxylase-like uncharacterized protein
MTNSLTILKSNQLTSVQDLGRFTAQHLGFSASGVADERAFLSGNQWLKNPASSAALEVVYGQLTLQANCACTIIITGADCQATLNEKSIAHWQIHQLIKNDILTLSAPKIGVYSYICIAGGFQTSDVLSSKSVLTMPFMAPTNTLMLAKQCYAALTRLTFDQQRQSMNYLSSHNKSQSLVLRFIPHQAWYLLSTAQQQHFLQQTYTISATSNKMGYRLFGEKLAIPVTTSALSKPACYGAIQLPSDGQPIILMKDRQTIGGYPTLGAVMQTDLFLLAHQRAGKTVQFTMTNIEQAQAQLISFYHKFPVE